MMLVFWHGIKGLTAVNPKKTLLGKKVNETYTGNVHGALKCSTWVYLFSLKKTKNGHMRSFLI